MRASSSQRGSAVVEFALVLPILLVLTLAVVQVGLLVRDELIVVQAARAGAREAAVSADPTVVRAAAVDAAVGLEPNRFDVVVRRTGSLGDPVAVDVRYAQAITAPIVAWLFPSSVSLTASAVARQEFA